MSMRNFIKYGLIIIWLAILCVSPVIFIQSHSLAAFNHPRTIFPLFGLLAFSLVWSQIMLGAFMRPLEQLYPRIFPVHIFQGLFTLGFALTHWLLLFSRYLPDKLNSYLNYQFIAPNQMVWAMFGQAALLLLIIGLSAGFLRNWAPIKRWWHWLHLVHYLVFFLVFFHSWNLGGDVTTNPILKTLWLFFLMTVLVGIVYRRIYIPSREGIIKATS